MPYLVWVLTMHYRIDNEEVPILDGSAKVFIDRIISAGIDVSESQLKLLKLTKR